MNHCCSSSSYDLRVQAVEPILKFSRFLLDLLDFFEISSAQMASSDQRNVPSSSRPAVASSSGGNPESPSTATAPAMISGNFAFLTSQERELHEVHVSS
jgi:hypothetical protein